MQLNHALQDAVESRRTGLVRMLLAAGANANVQGLECSALQITLNARKNRRTAEILTLPERTRISYGEI